MDTAISYGGTILELSLIKDICVLSILNCNTTRKIRAGAGAGTDCKSALSEA